MNNYSKPGVLLVNLGTPDAPSTSAVRRYLREFLMDPRVLDMSTWKRWLLVHGAILPKRPRESAEAYQTIWTDRGSPLLYHGEDLRDRVAERLGPQVPVALGMRYANPSIESAIAQLHRQGVRDITVFPLFPQYSSAAWGSAVEAVHTAANKFYVVPSLHVVPPYYADKRFIDTWVAHSKQHLSNFRADHTVMTFHGLPESHLTNSDPSGKHCLASADCCKSISKVNQGCYRAQCMATAQHIAAGMKFAANDYSVAFQSRLGRDPWIRPYTDELIVRLAKTGCKRLALISPSFTADCLETIEEIGMRAAEDFRKAGGEELRLVPSLNSEPMWCDAVEGMVREVSGISKPSVSVMPNRSRVRVHH